MEGFNQENYALYDEEQNHPFENEVEEDGRYGPYNDNYTRNISSADHVESSDYDGNVSTASHGYPGTPSTLRTDSSGGRKSIKSTHMVNQSAIPRYPGYSVPKFPCGIPHCDSNPNTFVRADWIMHMLKHIDTDARPYSCSCEGETQPSWLHLLKHEFDRIAEGRRVSSKMWKTLGIQTPRLAPHEPRVPVAMDPHHISHYGSWNQRQQGSRYPSDTSRARTERRSDGPSAQHPSMSRHFHDGGETPRYFH